MVLTEAKEDAITEMVTGGYGFHPMWSNIIAYINRVDVNTIKDAVIRNANSVSL